MKKKGNEKQKQEKMEEKSWKWIEITRIKLTPSFGTQMRTMPQICDSFATENAMAFTSVIDKLMVKIQLTFWLLKSCIEDIKECNEQVKNFNINIKSL